MFGWLYFGAGAFGGVPANIIILTPPTAVLVPIRAVAVLYRNGKPV